MGVPSDSISLATATTLRADDGVVGLLGLLRLRRRWSVAISLSVRVYSRLAARMVSLRFDRAWALSSAMPSIQAMITVGNHRFNSPDAIPLLSRPVPTTGQDAQKPVGELCAPCILHQESAVVLMARCIRLS